MTHHHQQWNILMDSLPIWEDTRAETGYTCEKLNSERKQQKNMTSRGPGTILTRSYEETG